MADPSIKVDPDFVQSPGLDDDVYEDTGDLEFKNTDNNDKMFFVRLPKYVWEAWSHLGEDDSQQIRIGTIRQWQEPKEVVVGEGKDRRKETIMQTKLKMLLFTDRPEHQGIPKEYELDVTEPTLTNTFLFTEQDLPGYKMKNKIKAEQQAAGIPQHLIRSSWAAQSDSQASGDSSSKTHDYKKKRFNPYRKAVPKKTSFLGRFRHEVNCAPIRNDESRRLFSNRAHAAAAPKRTIGVMNMHDATSSGVIHAGSQAAANAFNNFIKTSAKPVAKAKKQENKATRMERNQLLDLIYQCFTEYSFWSMKALRAKTLQPEAWLREILDEIADLHKSGTFANNWSLKPEYRVEKHLKVKNDGLAPDANIDPDASELDEEDEDGNVKMEDV